jgi:hypothetical protein
MYFVSQLSGLCDNVLVSQLSGLCDNVLVSQLSGLCDNVLVSQLSGLCDDGARGGGGPGGQVHSAQAGAHRQILRYAPTQDPG